MRITFHLNCERLKFTSTRLCKRSSDEDCLPIKDDYLFSLQRIFVSFVLLVVTIMSDLMLPDDVHDDFDLTPRAAARTTGGNVLFRTPLSTSNMTSEGFDFF